MIKLMINGCNGKMGRVLAAMAESQEGFSVAAGVDRFGETEGRGFPVYRQIDACDVPVDVVVDFSRPEALPDLLGWCGRHKIPLVLATTGYSTAEQLLIEKAAREFPIFKSANMSLGINLMMDLVAQATTLLGPEYDVEIVEQHHRQKVDAPSGTALALADAINDVLLKKRDYIFGRHTRTQRRGDNEIGIHAIRGGTLVGEHQVHFIGNDEVLEIRHTAYSKQILAAGTLRAVPFILRQTSGLYSMKDLLLESRIVTNLYTDNDQVLITLSELSWDLDEVSALFDALARDHIYVDMISQTAPINQHTDVSFTLPARDLAAAQGVIRALFEHTSHRVLIHDAITKVTVEGVGMAHQAGVAAKLLSALSARQIVPLAITTAETKISCCVDRRHERAAIEAIVKAFDL